MCAAWAKGYDQSLIVDKLAAARIRGDGKSVSWKGSTNEIAQTLTTAIEFSTDVPAVERFNLLRTAMLNVAKKGPITQKALIAATSREEARYFSSAARPYVLISTWSVQSPHVFRRIGPGAVTVGAKLSGRFQRNYRDVISRARMQYGFDVPNSFAPVRARVQARTVFEAYERALDALDTLRGIWNWFFNRHIAWRVSSGLRKPVNRIQLGPIHSLHEPDGKLATTSFWYETGFRSPATVEQLSSHLTKLKVFEQSVKLALVRSSYGLWIEEAIRRYVRALDPTDWEGAFLKTWSLLEHLTDAWYSDRLIERASFICDEPQYHRQVLRHLRAHRNASVHSGQESEERETHLLQAKRYAEALLQFHLRASQELSTREETMELLDSPLTAETLTRRRKILAIAFRIRGAKPKT